MVLETLEEIYQIGNKRTAGVLRLAHLFNKDLSLVGNLFAERVVTEIRIQVHTEIFELASQFLVILEWLGDRRSSQPHQYGQPFLVFQPTQPLIVPHFFLLLKVELFHYSRIWVVPSTVMALIENDKGVVSQLDVPPPQTVEKHLRDHHSYGSFLHLVDELLFGCKVGLNSSSLGRCRVLRSLPMDTNNLVADVLFAPVQLDVIFSQPLPEIPAESLILNN
jgi:hypothetical protein